MKVGLGADNASHDVVWNKGTLFWMHCRLRRKNTLPSVGHLSLLFVCLLFVFVIIKVTCIGRCVTAV